MNLVLLSATLLALLSGPLLYGAARDRPAVLAFLDGFVLVAISGLVMVEVLPETLDSGGYWSLAFLALGALGPSLFEQQLHNARRAHVATLVLAMAGLVLHSIGDGTALAPRPDMVAGDEPHIALALAIAVHSVPVGLMVWWLLFPVFGALLPALAIGAMCVGTVSGYVFAGPVSGWLGATGWAWLQALVAGSILHVVFGRPHLDENSGHRIAQPPFEGLGNLAALAALIVLENLHPEGQQSHHGFLARLFELSRLAAPALLLAWLAGALITRAQRVPAPASKLAGAITGLLQAESDEPLPHHLLQTNAGRPLPISLAWLAGASLLGLAALLLSIPFLGWQLSLIRVGAGLLIALMLPILLARLLKQTPLRVFRPSAVVTHRYAPLAPVAAPLSVPPTPAHPRLMAQLLPRIDRDAPWMLASLLIAALAAPYLQPAPWSIVPAPLLLPLFAALGCVFAMNPLASTPLAAALLAAGLNPGAALVFMLAGPLVNPSLLIGLARQHGRALAAGFAAASLLLTLPIGSAVSMLLPAGANALASTAPVLADFQSLSLIALVLLTAHSLLRRGGRSFFGMILKHEHSHDACEHDAHA
jgi:hypothetical protein